MDNHFSFRNELTQPSQTQPALSIEIDQLCRTYETYQKTEGLLSSIKGFWNRKVELKTALSPTTLKIQSGQIVGLVGSNGAGKTTLLKLLSGLIHPSSGSARVLGFTPSSRDPEYLRQISILLGQKNQLWWDLSPADSFELLIGIYNLNKPAAKNRIQELAQLLDCRGQLQTQLRRLSLGERMKMELIGSLLHQPKVLFLDEPTIGLDIIAQTKIREFLAHYVKIESPTIILTSHYMDDISLLADRLLLISHGKIVYDGTVQQFTSRAEAKQTVSMKLVNPVEKSCDIGYGIKIDAGARAVKFDIAAHRVGEVLKNVLSLSPALDIKIEEVEFEDVIRDFLEKGL